jgi:endonuclease YncB( thermonuclease family)
LQTVGSGGTVAPDVAQNRGTGATKGGRVARDSTLSRKTRVWAGKPIDAGQVPATTVSQKRHPGMASGLFPSGKAFGTRLTIGNSSQIIPIERAGGTGNNCSLSVYYRFLTGHMPVSLKRASLAFVPVLSLLASTSPQAREVSGIAEVADADTISVGNTRIRLSGVDAPESDQVCLDTNRRPWNCGIEAKRQLEDFVGHRPWSCSLAEPDRYGRYIAVCSVGGEDVSRWLVRNGWAIAFRRYSTAYVQDEDEARAGKRGLWSGAFIAPWDWRRRDQHTVILGAYAVPTDSQRQLISPDLTRSAPVAGCSIKANLRSDRCIYHVPGGFYYGRLNMERGSNRRWFCTEAEAQAAGCRRSRR